MYFKHFGLDRKPFEQLPDPGFLFLSKQHETALSNIGFAVALQDSFVIVTGEIGSGKTTLLHKFVTEELVDAAVAYVTQTRVSATELLQSILVEFGQDPFGKEKVELVTMLKRVIDEHHGAGRRVVIVIDEAQNLTAGVLEELRLVTCIAPGSSKMVNVILVGQPQFNLTIDSPALVQLKQRCRLRYHLKALTEEETTLYIEHRLSIAGGTYSEVFDPGLEDRLFRHSRGIPRLINMLCDTAMVFTYVDKRPRVTADTLQQAVDELGWSEADKPDARSHAGVESRPSSSPGNLAVLADDDIGAEYPITDAMCMVGRSRDCSIHIKHSALSRYHALIKRVDEEWTVLDIKSTNGLYVNGRRVQTARLSHDDRIGLGDHTLVFRLPSSKQPSDADEHDAATLTDIADFANREKTGSDKR